MPVILEEFGFSTYQLSEEQHAGFVNDVLWSALAHGAIDAFIWCFSDFSQEGDPPYEWRLRELGFGLVRADGTPKPETAVVRKFSQDLKRFEGGDLVIAVNHSYEAVTAAVAAHGVKSVEAVAGSGSIEGTGPVTLRLGPKQALAFLARR